MQRVNVDHDSSAKKAFGMFKRTLEQNLQLLSSPPASRSQKEEETNEEGKHQFLLISDAVLLSYNLRRVRLFQC